MDPQAPFSDTPYDATYPVPATPVATDPADTTDTPTTDTPVPTATPTDAPAPTDPTAPVETPDPAPVSTLTALDKLGTDFHSDFEQLKTDTQAAVDEIIDKAKARIAEFKGKVSDLLEQL